MKSTLNSIWQWVSTSAKTLAAELARDSAGNVGLGAAATQAALAEQVAAKAFNDFLNTGSTAYKVAQDIATTLNGPRIFSTLERHQLQTEQRNLETAWRALKTKSQVFTCEVRCTGS